MDKKNYKWLIQKKGKEYSKEKVLVIKFIEIDNYKELFYTSLLRPYMSIRIKNSEFCLFNEEDEADEYIKTGNLTKCKV